MRRVKSLKLRGLSVVRLAFMRVSILLMYSTIIVQHRVFSMRLK